MLSGVAGSGGIEPPPPAFLRCGRATARPAPPHMVGCGWAVDAAAGLGHGSASENNVSPGKYSLCVGAARPWRTGAERARPFSPVLLDGSPTAAPPPPCGRSRGGSTWRGGRTKRAPPPERIAMLAVCRPYSAALRPRRALAAPNRARPPACEANARAGGGRSFWLFPRAHRLRILWL